MYNKLTYQIELFLLDFFIYVLSESKIFRLLVTVVYKLITDRRFFLEFVFVCFISCCIGLGIGYWISMLTDRIF